MICPFCKRELETVSHHHLIPRARHNKIAKKLHEDLTVQLKCCRPCHDHIHTIFTEKELEREYNTPEKILAHPEIQKFAKWISNKPIDFRPKIRR